MDSLIVLGLVPGTNIQITFMAWLFAGASIVSAAALLYIKRRHLIMFLVLGLQLKRQLAQTDPYQLAKYPLAQA
jgi:hypothetical protein